MKLLRDLLKGIEFEATENAPLDAAISRIVSDSRVVKPQDLFVAVKGPAADGHLFIREAVMKGASAVVYENELENSRQNFQIPFIRVANSHQAFAQLLSQFYENVHETVKLIGATGTNGKTTTTYLIRYLLNQLSSCGLIGTIEYAWKNKRKKASNTTPGPSTLIPLLAEMAGDGISYCALEVSSHALDQARVQSLSFTAAVFTNLTQDHLDYHQNFENYFQAKRKLFVSEPKPIHSIVNADDPYGRRLINELKSGGVVTYGFSKGADYQAVHVTTSLAGSEFTLLHDGVSLAVKTQLPLYHNVYNVLASLATVHELGYSLTDAARLVYEFSGVPGRMERVSANQPFHVFVDYAHSPDAFQNVFSCVRPLTQGRLISVFGCGGNRDRTKRAQMGRIASEFSDILFLTNDNPRREAPQAILNEIKTGITSENSCDVHEALDRSAAIEGALQLADGQDVVLILGKGHEAEQIIGERVYEFSDADVARSILSSRFNSLKAAT